MIVGRNGELVVHSTDDPGRVRVTNKDGRSTDTTIDLLLKFGWTPAHFTDAGKSPNQKDDD